MARANYGAEVKKNGKRMPQRHYNFCIACFLYGSPDSPDCKPNEYWDGIVGDEGSGIIVLLYKDWIGKILRWDGDNLVEVKKACQPIAESFAMDPDEDVFEVEHDIDGILVKARMCDGGRGTNNAIEVEFTDPKGRKWWGKSGFAFGHGHTF